jgi:aminoglycoside phosphotransferase (APT) family kinase protein
MGKPWDSSVPMSDAIARAILEAHAELRLRSIRALKDGWDSHAFVVDDAWVVRFPKRAEVAARLAGELQLLTAFAPSSPIAVPVPALFGAASARYPFAYFGYRFLPGRAQSECELPLDDADFERFRRFLQTLHALPPAALPLLARDDEDDGANEGPRVPIHGDLGPEHVLMDPASGRIAGVIDWGDVVIGDPAIDLAGFGYSFGVARMHQMATALYAADDARALARAERRLARALDEDVWYGEETNDAPRIALARKRRAELTRTSSRPG